MFTPEEEIEAAEEIESLAHENRSLRSRISELEKIKDTQNDMAKKYYKLYHELKLAAQAVWDMECNHPCTFESSPDDEHCTACKENNVELFNLCQVLFRKGEE